MHDPGVADISSDRASLNGRAAPLVRSAGVIGLVGLALAALLGLSSGWPALFRAYIVAYAFVLSLSLGGLFFVMLHHVTRAGWSVVVRRLAEFVAATMPMMVVLFLPLLVPLLTGMKGVYPWLDAAAVQHDEALHAKQLYLNVPFFLVRWAIYFVIWIWLARYFLTRSLEQDANGDVRLTLRMQVVSGPGMVLFGFTLTFAAIDLLMSLSPHWFSTIFGVYYFAGSTIGILAVLTLLVAMLQRTGHLTEAVNAEHYHDLGKLIFAFTVFWAYIAYSQYMLIWYANIPEETFWYARRQAGPWATLSILALLFGHFVVPFLALLSRWPKRHKALLAVASVWMLLVHWFDLYWLAVPGATQPAGGLPLGLRDAACLVGVGGLFVAALARQFGHRSLIARGDPRLPESLAFENF